MSEFLPGKACSIAQALQHGRQQLVWSDSARLDCELLLLKAINETEQTKRTSSWLMTWPETLLSKQQLKTYLSDLQVRSTGMPIAYITGQQEFWTLTLKVTPATLIPRPETELLVESALQKTPEQTAHSILDLGTGTGAIALALAAERPQAEIVACDISAQALAIAQENARINAAQLNSSKVSFYQANWFDGLPAMQPFDIIVSNPPYIAINDSRLEDNVRNFEPLTALLSGTNGLDDIAHIVKHARQYLKPSGWLLLEHANDQAKAINSLLQQYHYQSITMLKDLNQHARVTMAQRAV